MSVNVESPSRVVLRIDRAEVPATALLLRGNYAVLGSGEHLARLTDRATVVLDWHDGSRTTLDGVVSGIDRSDPLHTSTALDLVGLEGAWSPFLKHVGDSILSMS